MRGTRHGTQTSAGPDEGAPGLEAGSFAGAMQFEILNARSTWSRVALTPVPSVLQRRADACSRWREAGLLGQAAHRSRDTRRDKERAPALNKAASLAAWKPEKHGAGWAARATDGGAQSLQGSWPCGRLPGIPDLRPGASCTLRGVQGGSHKATRAGPCECMASCSGCNTARGQQAQLPQPRHASPLPPHQPSATCTERQGQLTLRPGHLS